jgi:transcriptional regulator with XRE-family HTH domain
MPKTLKTWGDHVTKRRLEQGLLQREVARDLGVDETTIHNWERGHSDPALRFIPAIIRFLGYTLGTPTANSFGERIASIRRIQGLSQKRLAKMLEVDPSTVARWERGAVEPSTPLFVRLRKSFPQLLVTAEPDASVWSSGSSIR